jgi:hypothetical protein
MNFESDQSPNLGDLTGSIPFPRPGQRFPSGFANGFLPAPDAAAEPLPETFEPELRRIDELLRDEAASIAVPAGLAERVYGASVRMLPRPTALPAPLRRTGGGRARQLAMAASMGLSILAAVVYLARPGEIRTPGSVALASDYSYLAEVDPLAEPHPTVATLARAVCVSSFAEIDLELRALGRSGM